jgi:TRAP-type C4-dicarboxylate transport system permease large subunit
VRAAHLVTTATSPTLLLAVLYPVVGALAVGLVGVAWSLVGMLFTVAIPAFIVDRGVRAGRYTDHHLLRREQRAVPLTLAAGSVALGVLVLLVAGFATQSLHGVNPAWVAVAAAALLFLAGALDDLAFKQGMNLSFLLYVGVIMGFGEIFAHVQLDQWLAANVAGVTELARGSQTLFILLVAAVTMILTVSLRSGPVSILVALALFGPASSLGIDPWVVAMTVLLSMNLWVYPQQNMLYLTAYHATGERGFTHAQARPLALLYPVFVLLSIIASIPYWRLLGLLQ